MTNQNSNLKHLAFGLVLLLLLGLPGLALAQNANPPGLTDWELYVYGNGRVVFDIMNGIKMLMIPDAGETGFRGLLLVMATLGFVVLAVAAGFDPGKNILRMFTYILVVWGVIFASTGLRSNVIIVDMARSPTSMEGDYRVTGAPAIVVIPAALTSTVGMYFTRVIEAYYSIPGDFKLSGSAVGQFNLFGKMMEDATQFRITRPELKRSLSSYTANCVVPAMALGRLSGPVLDPATGQISTGYGTEALLRSTDLPATLSTARSASVLTTYFPYSPTDLWWQAPASAEVQGLSSAPSDLSRYAASGVLVSCATAWNIIERDLDTYAQSLLNAGAEAWERTGIMVPYETMFSTMLSQAAAPGGTTAANFSRPSGFIMQTAMVNSMNGSFRQAAVQTGNNELMQSVAISQAEAQQKSSWAASFSVFNNMMGYVFTVLQAFIFALTPFIVVALFIPGMGKSIFVNYAQVLVWLTLWQPMLSIINFIILLFGSESISSVVGSDAGITMGNSGLISERTSNLMVAAGFLGTMTPMLSWGIVKGAMAFTEFISAGVGSAFASQAGASAATGNISMGNLSMDNTSMNKYSTMMSSQVGAQAVSAGLGAGALSLAQDMGGSGLAVNNASSTMTRQLSSSLQATLSDSKAVGQALSVMDASQLTQSSLESMARGEGVSRQQQMAAQQVLSKMEGFSRSQGTGTTAALADTAGSNQSSSTSADAGQKAGFRAEAGVGTGGLPLVNAKMGANRASESGVTDQVQRGSATGTQATETTSVDKDKLSVNSGESLASSTTLSNSAARSADDAHRLARDSSANISQALQSAISENRSVTDQLTRMHSAAESFSANGGMSIDMYNQQMAQLGALQSQLQGGLLGAQGWASSTSATLGERQGSISSGVQAHMDSVGGRVPSSLGGGPSTSAFSQQVQGFRQSQESAQEEVAAAQRQVGQDANSLRNRAFQDEQTNSGSKVLQTATQAGGVSARQVHSPSAFGGHSMDNKVNSLVK